MSVLSRKAPRRGILTAERSCDIYRQRMLPGKDVATLLDLETQRLACSSSNNNGVMELARIVKDNLISKHLVLSTEEALIDCLQNNLRSNDILELEPMSSYHRSLLHRLAEIFGFSHESVGMGDERHLVLERCAESSMPPILVSDLLGDYGHYPPVSAKHILRRKGPPDTKDKVGSAPPSMTVEEREAAYLAARARIFSLDEDGEKSDVQLKPRNVPVVAQRMIAHALGHRTSSIGRPPPKREEGDQGESLDTAAEKDRGRAIQKASKDDRSLASQKMQANVPKCVARRASSFAAPQETNPDVAKSSGFSINKEETSSGDNLKLAGTCVNVEREQVGAAKRMFAHALGLPRGKDQR